MGSRKNAKIAETGPDPAGPAPATTSWAPGAWSAMPIPSWGMDGFAPDALAVPSNGRLTS